MKHTKCDISNGQWKSIEKKNGYFRVVAGDDNYPIANLYQNDANANLIASAPEMLRTLKYVQEWLRVISRPEQEKNMKESLANMIAKAEGGE